MMVPLRIMLLPAGLLVIAFTLGCASQRPEAKEVEATTPPDPRARELDLVVPDDPQDVTKLDDVALASQIEAMNRQVNELTAQTFEMALEPDGAASLAYRAKLRELKIAETRLGGLEQEQIRRQPPPR